MAQDESMRSTAAGAVADYVKRTFPRPQWREVALELLAQLGLDRPPSNPVRTLSTGFNPHGGRSK